MSHLIYYYALSTEPLKTESTEFIGELVTILYESKGQFISDAQRIELKLGKTYLSDLRKEISKYEERLPLYDINFNHIYLIDKHNIYPRIYYDNYRFLDQNFYQNLVSLSNPTQVDLENIRILSFYDLKTLNKTYMKIFYKSFVFNSYITDCRRPSFGLGMEHISPYYTINELYFLAYDWNLTNKASLTEEEIVTFCKEISQYDIPAQTLLANQMYIYDSKAIGLVKHYSLYGSYYINLYLRSTRCCLANRSYTDVIRNLDLERQIKIMIGTIQNAPAFVKSHTVYRFIEKDNFLKHLKVGDTYIDPSFMSTTRNPFYYKENYGFGFILLKIKLPPKIKGIGLCIESYSNFPNEEEIVLPPTSKFILERVVDGTESVHFHNIFKIKIEKKYEFSCIGNDYVGKDLSEIIINMPGAYEPPMPNVQMSNLIADPNLKFLSMTDRLKYFRETYVNINNQFSSRINDHTYVFNMESYDSTTVYKPFFYYEVTDGIMITTSNPKYGNINIMLELGIEIHVNYYFRFSVSDPSIVVDLNRKEWIEWLSILAYSIGSRVVVIHSNYVLYHGKEDTIKEKQDKTRYTFSQNIYLYLKHKKKLFEFVEITPNFDYGQLDYLFQLSLSQIITGSDRDELYRIGQMSRAKNLGDFYIYVVEKFPKLIKALEEKMDLIYDPEQNPFRNISYNLDAWFYLYDQNLIPSIPSDKEFTLKKGSFKKLIGDKKIPKFKNRLRTYLLAN